jgi:hypothetical protein
MSHPYERFESDPLWPVLDKAVDDLVLNADLQELTARPYIVGHLCKSLAPLVVAAVYLLWHVHEFPETASL